MNKLEALDSVVSCKTCSHHSVCWIFKKLENIISEGRDEIIFINPNSRNLIYNAVAKECSQFKMRE